MRWFVNRPHDNGCVYYRSTLPLRHLMPELAGQGLRVRYAKRLDVSEEYDAYFFGRWIDAAYIPVIVELKRRGKVIVWDLDDDLMGLERHEEENVQEAAVMIRGLQLCLDCADIVTVSTEALRARVGRPEKTVVVPNLIDLGDNPIEQRDGGRDTILYSGSPSHKADIELVRELHDETQGDFRWVWYGIKPKWMSKRDIWIPWSRVTDYPRVCRMVRPVVGLAPLTVERFNLSKSPIKVWEYATLGSSVIASDFGPYAGSSAAIVPAGEVFTRDHLNAVLEVPNGWRVLGEAKRNSWQHSETGRHRWLAMFLHVLSLCEGQRASLAA